MSKCQIAILVVVLAGLIMNVEGLCEKFPASTSKMWPLTERNGKYMLTLDVDGNDSVEVKISGFLNSESISGRYNFMRVTLTPLNISNELSIRVTNTYSFTSVRVCAELQFVENIPKENQGILVKIVDFLNQNKNIALPLLIVIVLSCSLFAIVICLALLYSCFLRCSKDYQHLDTSAADQIEMTEENTDNPSLPS